MRARWDRLIADCGFDQTAAGAVFEDLVIRHAKPQRHYHTLDHIEHCLRELDNQPVERRTPELEFALWFHDAISDPKRKDNEAASTALAQRELARLGLEDPSLEKVGRLIMATEHRSPPSNREEALITDIDLSILGQPKVIYDAYATAIRKEYGHVPGPLFRQGRAGILRGFLGGESIYSTTHFRDRYELQARANLIRELDSLC